MRPIAIPLAVILIALTLPVESAGEARAPDGDHPAKRHIIYLHGRIVQDQQNRRPQHGEYGHYELDEIAEEFRRRGFEVSAEMRRKDVSVSDAANDVVTQVRSLIQSGVPAGDITVVGASMGAAIAMRVAARLADPGVRFAFLSPCLSTNLPRVAAEEGVTPTGRLMAVRDESDIPTKECPEGGAAAREVVINTGFGHGFLYRPLREWVEPVVEWATP